MSKDYGTEFEIRQELEKLTTKEVIEKLKLWLYRPTEDIGIINTEQIMLERIEKDLEVLEMLRGIIQVYCVKRKRNNLYILASKNLSLTEEEYKKIKEWIDNDK